MDKEKLIREINHTLESAGVLAKQIQKRDSDIHQLDIDLLLEKTRNVYDKLILLDAMIGQVEDEAPVKPISEPEITESPIAGPERKAEKLAEISEERQKPEENAEVPFSASTEMVSEEPSSEDSTPDSQAGPATKDPEDARAHKEEEKTNIIEKSTIDLFSTAEPTISDQYSEQETVTLADKFNKEGINELREAIGINEKFLFINELFHGDMSKYNKVVDELDEMSTLKGAETYLLELKIQNQWEEDNPAFLKFSALLRRKFGI